MLALLYHTEVDGCKKIMQQGEALEGLHVRLLVQWFKQDPELYSSDSSSSGIILTSILSL
jgi:hypothetical protein